MLKRNYQWAVHFWKEICTPKYCTRAWIDITFTRVLDYTDYTVKHKHVVTLHEVLCSGMWYFAESKSFTTIAVIVMGVWSVEIMKCFKRCVFAKGSGNTYKSCRSEIFIGHITSVA